MDEPVTGAPTDTRTRALAPWPGVGVAAAAGLAVGALTSVAQGVLPGLLAPLANSAGSWSLAAFLLAALCPRPWTAALAGVLSLSAMVLGYDLASLARGYDASLVFTAFWLVAAVTVGPFLGLGGGALRARSRLAPAGVGAMSGVLVGEGVYGIAFISDTTPAVYWAGSVAVGLGLLAWAIVRAFPRVRPALAAVALGALVAVSFVAVYSSNPLALFTAL
ncbi:MULTISPECIES: DUF6518 family protein [unclassified Nocardiopsis]|uniref:DUF6518 family protein n=1 Tax=unclassified Nocardiopsis TaxID=2649073 RepID=UPI00135B5C7B|nr:MULTISPECIES: DUF6518 family protein [unclassified Nocardiopsis]